MIISWFILYLIVLGVLLTFDANLEVLNFLFNSNLSNDSFLRRSFRF